MPMPPVTSHQNEPELQPAPTHPMKKSVQTALLALSALVLTSCGDSHDKLMKDQISWMNETTAILEKVAAGSMSSADAAGKIKKLGEDAEEFMRRKETLNKGMPPEKLQELATKYREETGQAFKEYMIAIEKASRSGRMTQEIGEAIENMSPKSKEAKMIEDAMSK